jgi:hypothetical protein
MKDIKQITDEIRKMVQDTVEAGAVGNVQFFAIQALNSFGQIEGEGADLYTVCARETVVGIVKGVVKKYERQDSDAPTLDGFKHMRTAYPVHRGGDHLLVPVHLCTDQELEARADEFARAANGLRKHAKEIREYIAARQRSGKSLTA